MNATRLKLLRTVDEFESAVAGSKDRPLLLFKHSLTCATSAHAHGEVEAFLSKPGLPVDARAVHVQTGRAISDAIAGRFGIRHESPQVLLISNEQVVWHASHYGVSQQEIAAALERHRPSGADRPPRPRRRNAACRPRALRA
jgi:bacillithiol system protein YtxJ